MNLNALPQLAVGKHAAGSGLACIMNAVSYLQGDLEITDLPDCVWQPLAKASQILNDSICVLGHKGRGRVRHKDCDPKDQTCDYSCWTTTVLLCPSCTHKMWLIGARLIGTGRVVMDAAMFDAVCTAILRVCVESAADRGADEKLYRAALDFLDGKVTGGDLYSMHNQVLMDPGCADIDVTLGGIAIAAISLREAGTDKTREYGLVQAIRDAVVLNPWGADVMGKIIGEFERITGFFAIPPTRSEIVLAAERAGVVLV